MFTLIALIAGTGAGYWLGMSTAPFAGRVRAFVSRWWTP